MQDDLSRRDRGEMLLGRAVAAHVEGNLELAESLYRESADSGNPDALFQLAGLLGDEGRLEEAIEKYEKSARSGDGEARILAQLLAAQIPDRRLTAKASLREIGVHGDARAYTELGLLEAADEEFGSAKESGQLAIEGGDARGHLVLATIGRMTNQLPLAQEHLRFATELSVDGAATEYGRFLVEAGEYEEAVIAFEKASSAGEPGSYALLGSALHHNHDSERAEQAFETGLAKGDTSVYLHYGDMLADQGLVERALSMYGRAEIYGDTRARVATIELLTDLERFEEAEHLLQIALESRDDGAIAAERALREARDGGDWDD
jgi:tetratricopeptide (TPR) repeat protein